MTVSRIVGIGELPNAQITDKSVLLHNTTGDADGKDKNVTVAQMRDYLVKPEADRAKAAEAKLQSNLDAETARAKAAEAKLQSNLDAETARAKAAEEKESSERESADTAEAQARESADTTLQSNLDAETATRETDVSNAKTINAALLLAAAEVLEQKLKAELTRAVNAENELFEAAENESERAISAESALQAQLDTLKADEETEGSIAQAVNAVKTDILTNISDTITSIANTEIPKLTESALADVQKQVTAAQTQTAAVTVFDTRSTNETPEWYFKNYKRRIVWEFKGQSAVGFGSGGYCNVQTQVGWSDSSGGNVIQVAYANNTCKMRSGSGTTWGAWKTVY